MKEDEMLKKLDTIIALLAIQGKDAEDRLKILRSLGLPFSEISKLTGVPEGTLKTWSFKNKKTKI